MKMGLENIFYACLNNENKAEIYEQMIKIKG